MVVSLTLIVELDVVWKEGSKEVLYMVFCSFGSYLFIHTCKHTHHEYRRDLIVKKLLYMLRKSVKHLGLGSKLIMNSQLHSVDQANLSKLESLHLQCNNTMAMQREYFQNTRGYTDLLLVVK